MSGYKRYQALQLARNVRLPTKSTKERAPCAKLPRAPQISTSQSRSTSRPTVTFHQVPTLSASACSGHSEISNVTRLKMATRYTKRLSVNPHHGGFVCS